MPPPPPLTTARDIPLFVRSAASSAERRITPSWTIAQLKRKLEPITGIPPASQKLSLKLPGDEEERALEAEDEEAVQVGAWGLVEYAEIVVSFFLFFFAVLEKVGKEDGKNENRWVWGM